MVHGGDLSTQQNLMVVSQDGDVRIEGVLTHKDFVLPDTRGNYDK
jgi:hypothetical protein